MHEKITNLFLFHSFIKLQLFGFDTEFHIHLAFDGKRFSGQCAQAGRQSFRAFPVTRACAMERRVIGVNKNSVCFLLS